MKTQFNYLAALLTAGLTQKTDSSVDLSQANWAILTPYLLEHRLLGIANDGLAAYASAELPMPDREVVSKYRSAATSLRLAHITYRSSIIGLSREWLADEKRPLALGGFAFASLYPKSSNSGIDELVCIPLYKNTKDENVATKSTETGTFQVKSIRVTVLDSAVSPLIRKHGDEYDAILRKVFFAEPCTVEPVLALAYPNMMFRALYHLFCSQQLLLNTHLPLRAVIDWAMLLRSLSVEGAPAFDWSAFHEYAGDLGLTTFTKAFTALAVRLTGIELPEGAASLTASADDVAYLYDCLMDEEQTPDPTTQGRFSRFMGVLRNSKKYSRFSDLSPAGEAFGYLFKGK